MRQIVLDGTPRGCGTLKERACYAVGTPGDIGKFKSWYWLSGSLFPCEEEMIWCEVPARTQVVINPIATLKYGQLWEAHWASPTSVLDGLVSFGRNGIADHVGRQYTPFGFAFECFERGPSRRISPEIAKKLAGCVPFPIFFSHKDIPQLLIPRTTCIGHLSKDCVTTNWILLNLTGHACGRTASSVRWFLVLGIGCI